MTLRVRAGRPSDPRSSPPFARWPTDRSDPSCHLTCLTLSHRGYRPPSAHLGDPYSLAPRTLIFVPRWESNPRIRFRNLWPHTDASGFPPAPSPSDLRLFLHHPVSLDVTNGHSVPPVWVQVGYRPVRNLAHRRVRTSQAHALHRPIGRRPGMATTGLRRGDRQRESAAPPSNGHRHRRRASGGDPDRFHNLLVCCSLSPRKSCVAGDAVGTQRDVRHGHRDQLLRLLRKRSGAEDNAAERLKGLMDLRRQFFAPPTDLGRCGWNTRSQP